jgi:hypothetical protein
MIIITDLTIATIILASCVGLIFIIIGSLLK